MWDYAAGFLVVRFAVPTSILGGALAVSALALSQQAGVPGLRTQGVLALAVAASVTLVLGRQVYAYYGSPAVNDATTDINSVPAFRALPERASEGGGEAWKKLHAEAYPELQSLVVPWTVPETMAKAQAVAEKAGWNIIYFDPARGRMEATAARPLFGIHDAIVLRARKAGDGGVTRVDMRSTSRSEEHDLHVNAARLRKYLKDLRQS